jgi:hypothetical protein
VLVARSGHHVDGLDGQDWSEEWKVKWSLTFGDAQKWEGEDTITRMNGTEVGTPPSSPPDPRP